MIIVDPPRQHADEIVRKGEEASIDGGDVVHLEDVFLRLAEERTTAGHKTTRKYGRELVRKMFYAIQDDDGRTARVVFEDGTLLLVQMAAKKSSASCRKPSGTTLC